MFGIITKNYIEKIHSIFDEIGYHVNTVPVYKDFKKQIVYTISHVNNLDEAILLVKMFEICVNDWEKIQKLFINHLSSWKQYRWKGNSIVKYCSDDEAIGTFYFTNFIYGYYDKIHCINDTLDNVFFEFSHSHGCFKIDDDCDYSIRYSKISSSRMVLLNEYDECVADVVLSNKGEVFLDKNKTPFSIVLTDGYVEIYNKDYYDNLDDNEYIDQEKMIASIQWDLVEEKSELGVSMLCLYENVNDEELEILFLISISTFLLYKSYITNRNIMRMLRRSAAINSALYYLNRK